LPIRDVGPSSPDSYAAYGTLTTLLAPDIVEAVLDRKQAPEVTLA